MMYFYLWVALLFPVVAASLAGDANFMSTGTSNSMSTTITTTSTIKNIVVVGGTHGNEYTGIWCIKALDRTASIQKDAYPSLEISTLLGNPKAHMANKRFVDEDLNRQFSQSKLDSKKKRSSVESLRAIEIHELLGPKGDNPKTDVIVDLHSTTSNMGLTIIIPEGDDLMAAAASYVMMKCDGTKCLMHSHPSKESRPNLSSTARHGFTIEVGPVPQGVLRHDAVEQTEQAMHALFEFLQRRITENDVVQRELQHNYPNQEVPCFRSAPAKRHGEMSGKIPWPCDPTNANFPTYLIHPNVQDRDFELVYEGDPLFIDLHGNTIPYTGSHGSPVHLMFVNEGGYYYASSGTGIGVAIPATFDFQTGLLIKEEVAVVGVVEEELVLEQQR